MFELAGDKGPGKTLPAFGRTNMIQGGVSGESQEPILRAAFLVIILVGPLPDLEKDRLQYLFSLLLILQYFHSKKIKGFREAIVEK